MADTFDDEIIDLTDLMEEGEPSKKESGSEPRFKDKAKGLPPESFDLGKEISLEEELTAAEMDPVSRLAVEDIPERGKSAAEDFDALIKDSAVEVAGAEVVAEEKVVFTEPFTEEERRSSQEDLATTKASSTFDDFFKEAVQEAKAEVEILEPATAVPSEEEIVLERPETPKMESASIVETPTETVTPEPQTLQTAIPTPPPPLEENLHMREEMEASLKTATATLKEDIPAMLEGIIRPVMGELVREVIKSTRDLLPGIVEKIIRDEIEKLKKLD